MFKKILSVVFAALMIVGVLAACGEKPVSSNDSSTVASAEDVSSEKEASSSSKKESSSNKTQSVSSKKEDKEEKDETSSSKKNNVRPGNDEEDETSSETESEGIKQYKNNKTVMIGCFHLSMGFCSYYGKNSAEQEREFREICEQKYFNTYLLGTGPNLLTEAKIIAENGGTFWLSGGKFNSKTQSLDAMIEDYKFYIDLLNSKGYGDLLNGFYWDEPILGKVTNDDFLMQTEALYKNFGLRNFPVFGDVFFNFEGNEDIIWQTDRRLETKACKYLTDVGFDSYSTDVRDGAPNGGAKKFEEWQRIISKDVVDGKSFYTEKRKQLMNIVGHPANFWHYPTAYVNYLWGGLNGLKYSDEDYCIANLEFLVEDVLKQEYPGGVILYTYADFHGENTGFRAHADVKKENGEYAYVPQIPKWEKYCKLLRDTTERFNKITPKLYKINA